jgi:hypothetical protein
VAEGSELSRLSVWYEAGSAPVDRGGWFVDLEVYKGYEFEWWSHERLREVPLSPRSNGRIDVVFHDPIQMIVGATYSFSFALGDCSEQAPNVRYAECDVNVGPEVNPGFLFTQSDAYGRGYAYSTTGLPFPGDLWFEAVFVPEPSRTSLLLCGLASVFIVAHFRSGARSSH